MTKAFNGKQVQIPFSDLWLKVFNDLVTGETRMLTQNKDLTVSFRLQMKEE